MLAAVAAALRELVLEGVLGLEGKNGTRCRRLQTSECWPRAPSKQTHPTTGKHPSQRANCIQQQYQHQPSVSHQSYMPDCTTNCLMLSPHRSTDSAGPPHRSWRKDPSPHRPPQATQRRSQLLECIMDVIDDVLEVRNHCQIDVASSRPRPRPRVQWP